MTNYKYKYNELEYAKNIEKNGFMGQYYKTEMLIMAKYWKYQGIKPAQRKILMYEFCSKHIEGFTRELFYQSVNSALNRVKKKNIKLIIIDSLPITVSEFGYIKGLDVSNVHKRVLFSYLVKNKLNKIICTELYGKASEFNYYGGSHRIFNESKDMAGMKRSENIYHLNGDMDEMGLIEIVNKGKIKLNFIDKIKSSEEIMFDIKDFNLVYGYFDYFNRDGNYILCEKCQMLVKKKSNKSKYCTECAKEVKEEQDKIADKKYKEKIKARK